MAPAVFIVVGLQQPRCIGEMSQYSSEAEVRTYQRTCITAFDYALLLMQAYVLPQTPAASARDVALKLPCSCGCACARHTSWIDV